MLLGPMAPPPPPPGGCLAAFSFGGCFGPPADGPSPPSPAASSTCGGAHHNDNVLRADLHARPMDDDGPTPQAKRHHPHTPPPSSVRAPLPTSRPLPGAGSAAATAPPPSAGTPATPTAVPLITGQDVTLLPAEPAAAVPAADAAEAGPAASSSLPRLCTTTPAGPGAEPGLDDGDGQVPREPGLEACAGGHGCGYADPDGGGIAAGLSGLMLEGLGPSPSVTVTGERRAAPQDGRTQLRTSTHAPGELAPELQHAACYCTYIPAPGKVQWWLESSY